jgi:hypothetical protein
MDESSLRVKTKAAVGSTLAGSAGSTCMRTKCQDIVPRCMKGPCRYVSWVIRPTAGICGAACRANCDRTIFDHSLDVQIENLLVVARHEDFAVQN